MADTDLVGEMGACDDCGAATAVSGLGAGDLGALGAVSRVGELSTQPMTDSGETGHGGGRLDDAPFFSGALRFIT